MGIVPVACYWIKYLEINFKKIEKIERIMMINHYLEVNLF